MRGYDRNGGSRFETGAVFENRLNNLPDWHVGL